MSANKQAVRFVKQLSAAFGKWRISDDTIELYTEKLSKYRLPEDRWNRALSRIIADCKDDNLPPLSLVYEYLERQETLAHGLSCKAMMTFTLNGKRKAVRVEKVDGVWLWAKWEYHDRDGNIVVLQKNPGKAAIPPKGATDIVIQPEEPADPLPEEMPADKEEIKQIFAANWRGSPGKLQEILAILDGPVPVTKGLEPTAPIIGRIIAGAVTRQDLANED